MHSKRVHLNSRCSSLCDTVVVPCVTRSHPTGMSIAIPSDLEYLPVHRYARSPRQQTAFERREAARRKAEQRERQRDAGVPDPTAIERAVVDAVRIMLAKRVAAIDPVELLKCARDIVVSRSCAAHEQDPSKPKFEKGAVVDAINRRVLVPPRASRTAP